MGVNIRNSALMIRGEDNVTCYESSREVKRGFCRVCGSTLFWKPELKGYEWVGVSAALFDQPLPEKICKYNFVADKGKLLHHRRRTTTTRGLLRCPEPRAVR